MTKKDYNLITLGLAIARPGTARPDAFQSLDKRDTYDEGRLHAWTNTCYTVADSLALKDYRFDKRKFLTDCGIQD